MQDLGNQMILQERCKRKLALIQRGEITFDEKIKNAKEAGAKAVIVYNNVDGEITSYLGESTSSIPSFRLTKVDGEKLQAKAVQGDVSLAFGELSNIKQREIIWLISAPVVLQLKQMILSQIL